jgi:hypothetical protein
MTDAPPLPRARLSRLPGDPVSRLGHNAGPPLDPGRSWRAHCWRAARKALTPHLPVEVIRRRVARARELGLAYPDYAAILLGTGRDVAAFLFTSEAIGQRLERQARLSAAAARKLPTLVRVDRLLMAGPEGAALAAALARAGAAAAAGGPAPPPLAPPADGRAAIRALLAPLGLPGDAVAMIGARADERAWAEAARLATFIAAPAYFAS